MSYQLQFLLYLVSQLGEYVRRFIAGSLLWMFHKPKAGFHYGELCIHRFFQTDPEHSINGNHADLAAVPDVVDLLVCNL